MIDRKTRFAVVWALGLSQIVGYGTIYYSFSVLASEIAAELAWSQQWVFGAFSAALLAAGLTAPVSGRLADRFGAGRVMSWGSVGAALALMICATLPGRAGFVVGLVSMQVASSFVLYATAFIAVVQIDRVTARRTITHLTLVAGFASTLFWPLTAALERMFDWRAIYLLFAVMHLLVCLPIHLWLSRLSRATMHGIVADEPVASEHHGAAQHLAVAQHRPIFVIMLLGFAIEGFVLASILAHLVPLTSALGFGGAGLAIAALFGPAQVASRLINMMFGERLAQAWLAVIAAALLPCALAALLLTAPWPPGAVVFVVLFGMGSGLATIVGGTLPLELFGRAGYGARVGWATSARQFTSAFAPFALAAMMAVVGVTPSLWTLMAIGVPSVAAFLLIVVIRRQADGRLVR